MADLKVGRVKFAPTPGPWMAKRIEYGHAIVMGPDAQSTYPREWQTDHVIEWEHGCSGAQAREAEANARLIAAAPELLAALKWVASVVKHKSLCPAAGTLGPDTCNCGLRIVHDAIAKAEGR